MAKLEIACWLTFCSAQTRHMAFNLLGTACLQYDHILDVMVLFNTGAYKVFLGPHDVENMQLEEAPLC